MGNSEQYISPKIFEKVKKIYLVFRRYAISRVIERRALEGLELRAERVGWSGGGAILDRIKEKVVEEEKSKQQQQQQQ